MQGIRMLGDVTIWILTDGKIGDLVQCRGVASRLSDRVEERMVAPGRPWDLLAPYGPIPPRDAVGRPGSPLTGPPPDLLIASGRRTVPYVVALKRAAPGMFTVFLKNPRRRTAAIDLVWAPSHDRISGPNIFTTSTGPHPFTPARLAEARVAGEARFAPLAAPLTGIILGGDTGSVKYTPSEAARVAGEIGAALAGRSGTPVVVPSRRTPPALLDAIRTALPGAWIWDGTGENPYLQILTMADRLIVTGDSHNMVSEAVTRPVPVHVIRPTGLAPKLSAFLDRLEAAGHAHRLATPLGDPPPLPLDASEEITAEIARRLRANRPAQAAAGTN